MTNHDGTQSLPDQVMAITKAKRKRFNFLTPAEMKARPPLEWRVQGVIPTKGVATIFGPSGSGKSFLLLDLMAAIAEGRDWHSCATKACRILCLVLEGEAGVQRRMHAWEKHNGRSYPDQVHFMTENFALNNDLDVTELIAAIQADGGYDMILIDTLNRAAPNADENSSSVMSLLISEAGKLQAAMSGLVVLVHHTGKDAARGPRGHSSLNSAMDATIEVSRSGEDRCWKLHKVKDGDDGAVYPFKLLNVELDAEEKISSCVVIPGEGSAAAFKAGDTRKPMSKNQRAVFETIKVMLEEMAESCPDSLPSTDPYVEITELAERAKDKVTGGAKHSALRIKEALEWLESNGYIVSAEETVWLPEEA
jgi:hypothetical protein